MSNLLLLPPSFSLREKRKISRVLRAQEKLFQAGLDNHGYNNSNGGCPNCGDTGGFHVLIYELEQAFGLRDAKGKLNKKATEVKG